MTAHRDLYKLSTHWDEPPPMRCPRQVVSDPDKYLDRLEQCKPWGNEKPWKLVSDRKTRLEDFPMSFIPVLSRKARDLLEPVLESSGEFVPVTITYRGKRLAAEYFIYNCLNLLDVADRVKLPPEAWETPTQLKIGVALRIDRNKVPRSADAFRFLGSPMSLIVSERVARRLVESDLSGWALMDPEFPPLHRKSILSPHRPSK
jgi:hypothetical protein